MPRATAKRNAPMTIAPDCILDHDPGKWEADGYYHRRDLAPGAAQIEKLSDESTVLTWVCPCGCAAVHFVLLNPLPETHGWKWDGNLDKPTLTPSLGMHPKDGSARDGSGYHWHGFLTAGIFEEC